MEELVVKWHILRLSTYQLPKKQHQATPLWFLNSYWCGHQYVLRRIKSRKSIKTDIILCQYSVMEALVVKCDILNLAGYQLQMIIPPRDSAVVPELVMVWAPVYS